MGTQGTSGSQASWDTSPCGPAALRVFYSSLPFGGKCDLQSVYR